nr:unnamed protein product [Digitaria exilis]
MCGYGYGGGVLPTFKIFCKADENFCLTVHDGAAVLAPADASDERQHWYKTSDSAHSYRMRRRNPPSPSSTRPPASPSSASVKLVQFDQDSFDNTLMWTLSNEDSRDGGFGFIRTLNDISLKLAAFHHGDNGVTTVKLSDSCDGDNHQWKILPWRDEAIVGVGRQSMRIYCKADEGFSVTIRNGTVCLAPTDPGDEHQHWVEDTRYGDFIKDEDGFPAITIVNRATGDAIKKSEGKVGPVQLVPYDPHYMDKSLLWSKSGDINDGFHYIRMVDNIYRNLDICDKGDHDKYQSGVQDGTKVMVSHWCDEGDSQYWRMASWSSLPT